MTGGLRSESSPGAPRAGIAAGRLALEGLAAAALSVLCAAWVLRLWRGNLALPLRYSPVDDTKFYLMLVKGIVDHGWYSANSSLGAPYGQRLLDYPQGADSLNLLLIRGLSVFSSNPALITNLFFLATFALSGFTAHLVLRALGVGALAAGVAAVLFSELAYHFFRGESHLFLSAYYAVPLAAYLFLSVLADAPLFSARAVSRRRLTRWVSPRSLITVAICVVIASDNLYYATFAVLILAGATLGTVLLRRRRGTLNGLAVIVLIVATVGVNLAPSLIYRQEHGVNVALERSLAGDESSSEAFALRLPNLLLPAPGARFAPLRGVSQRYDRAIAPGYCEACYASLGTVGDAGFIWLTLCGLAALLGVSGLFTALGLLRNAALGAWIAVAVGAVGGLSSLLEAVFTPDIRGWNRISVLIAFLSLLAVAVLLDRLRTRLLTRHLGGPISVVALAAVLVFGVLDQTSDSYIPPYRETARQWNSDGRLVRQIEGRLGSAASVFELPYVPFPEGYPETAVGGRVATYATKYEPLRGYLHSSRLRWSYGAIKGRPLDWTAQLAGEPLPYVLAAAASAGFSGLWVDPAGFEAPAALRLRASLRSMTGGELLTSPDGDLWFFALHGYLLGLERQHAGAEMALLRERTLHPLRSECVAGGLALTNPTDVSAAVTLRVRLAHATPASEGLPAVYPDGRVSEPAGTSPVTVTRRISLSPGRTVIANPRARTGAATDTQVLYSSLTDDALMSFDRPPTGASSSFVPGLTGPPCAS